LIVLKDIRDGAVRRTNEIDIVVRRIDESGFPATEEITETAGAGGGTGFAPDGCHVTATGAFKCPAER